MPSLRPVDDVCEALVVGAGPAGAAAAAGLRRAGADVISADAAAFPRDKVCGDGLGPGVVTVLDELGLAHVLDGEDEVTGCVVWGPGGAVLDADLPSIAGRVVRGHVVPRERFDDRLRSAVLATGVRAIEQARFVATSLAPDGDRLVDLDTPDGPRTVKTRLLVGADGAGSRVRRALGVARNGPRRTAVAVRAYVHTPEPPPVRRLGFDLSDRLLPAYGWWFPATGDLVNVGLGLTVADQRRRGTRLDDELDALVDSFAATGRVGSAPRSVRTALLPYATTMPPLAHERAVLVGDAGSMVNPLSGEGIFYGMAAGAMLGSIAGRSLRDAPAIDAALLRWDAAVRRRFQRHHRSNALAQALLRSPAFGRLGVRAAAADERVLADVVALLFGEGVIDAGSTRRLVSGALRPRRASR